MSALSLLATCVSTATLANAAADAMTCQFESGQSISIVQIEDQRFWKEDDVLNTFWMEPMGTFMSWHKIGTQDTFVTIDVDMSETVQSNKATYSALLVTHKAESDQASVLHQSTRGFCSMVKQ